VTAAGKLGKERSGGTLHPLHIHPPEGLSGAEADRRLLQYGPNQLSRRTRRPWYRLLVRQVSHPLALLLWAAAGLAIVAGAEAIALAIVGIVILNALFAFVQETQAERAVEALASYIPQECRVRRDGQVVKVLARDLVPGDVLLVGEGDRVSADAHLISGAVEIDMAALSGESLSVLRTASNTDVAHDPLEAQNMIFSGSSVIEGEAEARVVATGMHSQIGRIAALSEQVEIGKSPLEAQVRRVAWIIAVVAVIMGIAFMPLAILIAGLPVGDAAIFAVALLVGNVPEGLLPIITLSLAMGAKDLAKQGAIVKRLSAVETLGSTTIICTDKTGTLTQNRMRVEASWGTEEQLMFEAAARCSTAQLVDGVSGDPTEVALLQYARDLGVDISPEHREQNQLRRFSFNPELKRMSTVDRVSNKDWLHCKGAPESLLPLCDKVSDEIYQQVDAYAAQGLRVLAIARKAMDDIPPDISRIDIEQDLHLLGLVALEDPPRSEVMGAVAACHEAGIRIFMITGDHGLTAQSIAHQVGILGRGEDCRILTGEEVEGLSDTQLWGYLHSGEQVIFSRSAPQVKLRVADLLSQHGEIVSMTGDGANDAPALKRAEIGVAMGRSGTDVARESATMILTDDNFATIVQAIRSGRQVFQNVRKFIFYILAHTTPEVVPVLVFALSGGLVPLPLPIPMLLAFDVGTEIFPALALGREPAEPGIMHKPPRAPRESVINPGLLVRAWLFVGLVSSALQMLGFFLTLWDGGWSWGQDVPHHLYQQATTMTLAGMIACQVGVAFAARTERASLSQIGVWSNPAMLWGIGLELLLAAGMVYLPPLQGLLGTTALDLRHLLWLLPFPFVVWGADETRKWLVRSYGTGRHLD